MITNEQEKAATRILNTLERRAFADWYQTGRFDQFIRVEFARGTKGHISKRDILEDIVEKFGITEKGTIE